MTYNLDAAEDLRRLSAKILIPFMFLHIPIVLAIGFFTGNNVTLPAILIGFFALVPFLSYRMVKTQPLTRYLTAISFMLIIATLVFAMSGHPWQIDMHMYFFAGLAMLLGFADWRVYIVATTVIAVHHLALNFLVPSWVFPEANFFRVVLHAVIVIFETAILALATVKLVEALDNASKATQEATTASEQLNQSIQKQRDIEVKAQETQSNEIESIAVTFEKEVGSIVTIVQEASEKLKAVANEMSEGASNVRNNANDAADASCNIAQNVNSVASASDQLSSSVNEISKQVNHSTQISSDAADMGQQASHEVQNLSQSVNEISNVIQLISDIANQTNLLALNATIEAARAGEAGKGFAVVASEVKNLANQTAKATEQITQQIESIIGATDDTVRGIEGINTTLIKVQETSSTIAAAIEEQNVATKDIAGNASQAANDVDLVSKSVDNVKQGAVKNVGRAKEVLDASEKLSKQAQNLSENLTQLVGKLRENTDQRRQSSSNVIPLQDAGE